MSKQTYPLQNHNQAFSQMAPKKPAAARVPNSRTWAHTMQVAKSSESVQEPPAKRRKLTFGRFRKKKACSKLLQVMNTAMFTPAPFHAVGSSLPPQS